MLEKNLHPLPNAYALDSREYIESSVRLCEERPKCSASTCLLRTELDQSAPAKSPMLSSFACISCLFLKLYQPCLLRTSLRLAMMERISAQVGEDDEVVASTGALCAEQVNGLGVVMSLASCSFATTGTGPRNSET